jgi:non-ribosomal peptide synthetase component E (peptide arylation enzyme)
MSNDYLFNMQRTAAWMGFTPDDVMFMPMPMIHNACMICFLGPTLLSGAAFAIPRDMTPTGWGEVFSRVRPTFVGLIRALLPRLESMISEGLGSIESVRAFWSPDGTRVVREKFGRPSYAMFGMSEGLNMYTRPQDPDEVVDWTVGRPISACDEVRLVEPGTEREVGFDEPGELTCRGPYTISGYYNAPDRNAQAFTADGFYCSGDMLIKRLVDGEVIYAFAGRAKDVVSRGHEKVNCEELESAVVTHPAVADCAVVGMPDEKLGERICAYVVVKPGETAPDVAGLAAHLQRFGLAKFKWPERIEVVEGLALTKVGKLDKGAMRADIARKVAKGR